MNINVLEKYVNLCVLLRINPSWKGLREYYNHNKSKGRLKSKVIYSPLLEYKN